MVYLNLANQEHERQIFTAEKYRSFNQQREKQDFSSVEWTYERERELVDHFYAFRLAICAKYILSPHCFILFDRAFKNNK